MVKRQSSRIAFAQGVMAQPNARCVARPSALGHSKWVTSIQSLRNRLHRAPLRALSWLLIAVFAVASVLPGVTMHAHADAAVGHHHDGGFDHPDHDGEAPVADTDQPATPTTLHVHDASFAFAPGAWPVLVLTAMHQAAPPTSLPPNLGGVPLPPLHRPPIV